MSELPKKCYECGTFFKKEKKEIKDWFDCSICGTTYIQNKKGLWKIVE